MFASKNLQNGNSLNATLISTKKILLNGTDISTLIASGGGGGGGGNNYDTASSIAIGLDANKNQGSFSIGIGSQAGQTFQGTNAVAIGKSAGRSNQHSNTIVISASGVDLNTAQSNSLYIDPIRSIGTATASNLLAYNTTNKEIQYCSNVTMSGTIAATQFFSSSDARLKDNIQPFPPVLEKLSKVDPVLFEWKHTGRKDYGFIAQNFFREMDFLKEAHKYHDNEFPIDSSGNPIFYSMEYPKITAILCKAIQELKEQVDSLRFHLESMEKDIAI